MKKFKNTSAQTTGKTALSNVEIMEEINIFDNHWFQIDDGYYSPSRAAHEVNIAPYFSVISDVNIRTRVSTRVSGVFLGNWMKFSVIQIWSSYSSDIGYQLS